MHKGTRLDSLNPITAQFWSCGAIALVLDSVTLIASFPHGHAPACFRINDSNNLFSDESQVLKRLKSTVGTMWPMLISSLYLY